MDVVGLVALIVLGFGVAAWALWQACKQVAAENFDDDETAL